MTLRFGFLMILGLCMIPGGIILGFILMAILAALDFELGAVMGFVPGAIITVAGIAVFLVGLGMELH